MLRLRRISSDLSDTMRTISRKYSTTIDLQLKTRQNTHKYASLARIRYYKYLNNAAR